MNSSFPTGLGDQHADILATIADNRVLLGTTAALGAVVAWYFATTNDKRIKKIRGWPIVGQWAFFTKRYDFLRSGFQKLPSETLFGFSILEHNIVAMRGENARKTFFDRRDLNFNEGYRILFGGVPMVEDIVEDAFEKGDKERASDFLRRLTLLLRPDRLNSVNPQIMADLERNMVKWGTSGKFDPFDDIYSIVFQATIRTIGCREIADSMENCKRLEQLYWHVEKGSTPTSLLLPWFPSQARKLKTAATTEIYMWLDSIIKARQNENRRENDALQDMLDSGESTPTVVQTIMGALFAGIVNSGLMAAWVFIFLDQAPEWRAKVTQELRSLLNKYAPLSGNYASAAERFSDVPLEAWENEMPILEDCLRETIRLILSGAALRRVTQGDLEFEGKTIPNGTFLVYPLGETHTDPNIYPEPSKFNPGRFAEGQDKSQTHAFLGWGVGRHPCAGRRFAQYEIKAIVAMFLASYDYEVINSKGARPKNEVFYIKYTKRDRLM